MAEIKIRLPKMGESVTEATITNWLKKPGENVALDEPLVEVATDKVDNELPSEAEGVLVKQLFQKDQVAQVGDVIAIISTDGESNQTDTEIDTVSETNIIEQEAETPVTPKEPIIEITSIQNGNGHARISKNSAGGNYYSPLVRSIAEKEGVTQEILDAISGSGLDGRVTKKDILAYVNDGQGVNPKLAQENTSTAVQTPSFEKSKTAAPLVVPNGEDEII